MARTCTTAASGVAWALKIWAEFVRERGGEVKRDREMEWGFGCLDL